MNAETSESAMADAHMIALAVDIVIHDDGEIGEGIPGGHAWKPRDLRIDAKAMGPKLSNA